tara:strand:- start:415 stop:1203 length:789 start_codon:yes stop_codon:yes gene_type:complete
MKKVAFLNLSYNAFNKNDVWKDFFDQGSSSEYNQNSFNLYIHPKDDSQCVFSDYFIDNRVETGWGHFSLVEATIELMKAALEDEDNEYFTLISDSHIPLYSLEEIIKLIEKKYSKMTFSTHGAISTKQASQRVLKHGVQGNHHFNLYNAVCQFFVCRRKDAIKFIETFDHFSQFFIKNEVIFADEFYFWAVARELKMDFDIGQASTYSDWHEYPIEGTHAISRQPREMKYLNSLVLKTLRDQGFLFARKVMPTTEISADIFN